MRRVGDRQKKPVPLRLYCAISSPARLETPLEITVTAAEAQRADNKGIAGTQTESAILE